MLDALPACPLASGWVVFAQHWAGGELKGLRCPLPWGGGVCLGPQRCWKALSLAGQRGMAEELERDSRGFLWSELCPAPAEWQDSL